MKLLETKAVKKKTASAVTAVPGRSRDPWYSDDERKAAIEGRDRWAGPRRRGWLK